MARCLPPRFRKNLPYKVLISLLVCCTTNKAADSRTVCSTSSAGRGVTSKLTGRNPATVFGYGVLPSGRLGVGLVVLTYLCIYHSFLRNPVLSHRDGLDSVRPGSDHGQTEVNGQCVTVGAVRSARLSSERAQVFDKTGCNSIHKRGV